MWLQRRRFGMVRPLRLVAVAMICVYTMTLAGLTVAPAYDVAVTCRNRVGGVLRADPFHTVAETLGLYRGGAGWLELATSFPVRSEEHTSELQSRGHLVCRLLLEKKKRTKSTSNAKANRDPQHLDPTRSQHPA